MNIFRRINLRLRHFYATWSENISDLLNPKKWIIEWAAGGRATKSGEVITESSALGISAYYACLRAISEDVAKLPLITYRRLERGKERVRNHPIYTCLHDQPNEDMSAIEFRQLLQHWALGWGNGYAEIVKSSSGKTQLYPIHPSRVLIVRAASNPSMRIYRVQNNDNTQTDMKARDVFHLHGLGNEDGGYSICQIARESLGLTLAAQSFGSSFFGSGSTLSGVLTHPETLSPEAQKRLRDSWVDLYGGGSNAFKPAILEDGMKYEQIGIPPEDAQFLETRLLQVEEVCRWFRCPPHKIQHLLRSTFSNISHQAIEYVVDTLTPWLTRWEQEIQRKLLVGEPDIFAEHLALGLLRGDEAARVQFYNGMFMIGAMSQNDIREAENMNGIGDDGDVYYVPLNMVRSQDAAAGLARNAANTFEQDGNQETIPPPGPMPDEDEPEDEGNPAPEPEPEPEEEKAEPIREPRHSMIAEAMRPVLEQVISQALKKEERAALRSSEKFSGNADAFSEWVETFYTEHALCLSSILRPPGEALRAMANIEISGANGHSQVWNPALITQNHVEESKKELRRMFGLEAVASEFPGYISRKIKSIADDMIAEVANENIDGKNDLA